MRILLIFIMFILNSLGIFAQNLVPNPSFEDYTSCPTGGCGIYKAIGWTSYSYIPDYLNACNTTGFSVPENALGFQYAATGNAYAGIGNTFIPLQVREYIGRQLLIPLTVGQKYFVNFKAVLALKQTKCANNKLGILFSTVSYSLDSLCGNITLLPTLNFAHIYTDSIIIDTLNWSTISGSFIADSAYEYVIIGTFFNNVNTNYINLGSDSTICQAYYFIDDIYVAADSLTSITEYDLKNTVNIYPNPAKSFLNVKIPIIFGEIAVMKIYNLMGDLMSEYIIQSPVNKIQLPNIRTGIYILSIQTKQLTIHKKLVILN